VLIQREADEIAALLIAVFAVKSSTSREESLFKQEGGFREKMGEARREQRTEAHAPEGEGAPNCVLCGSVMRRLQRKTDNSPFWGCSNYPGCRGTRPYAKA
jgi:hypothetical protein